MRKGALWTCGLVVLLASGACSSIKRDQALMRVTTGDPIAAPVATRLSPALDCFSEMLAHEPPIQKLDVWVCPFATSDGISPESGWQYTMDAFLRVARPGGPVIVRDCKPEWTPLPASLADSLFRGEQHIALPNQPHRPPVDPAEDGQMSITGRAVLERGLFARNIDFAAGWYASSLNSLGIGAKTEMDRMAVSLYLRNNKRLLLPHPATAAAVYLSTEERNVDLTMALVDGVGISAGAGMLEVTSKEQILRHLVEVNVLTMLIRYFDAGSECSQAAHYWETYRDEFMAATSGRRGDLKRTLVQRMGGARAMPKLSPTWNADLSLDEYVWARSAGRLTEADLKGTTVASADPIPVVAPRVAAPVAVEEPRPRRAPVAASRDEHAKAPRAAAPPPPATAPSDGRAGLFFVNGRLVSAADGYAECFATDTRTGSRVQRLRIGGPDDGQVFKLRAYAVAAPGDPGLDRVVCFRTGSSLYEFMPTQIRGFTPQSMFFRDVAQIFERRGWQLAVVEKAYVRQ